MALPAGCVLLVLLLLASSGHTDEGLFPGGRRVQGSLSLDKTGWHFVPAGKTTPLAQTPRLVRFDLSAAPPLRAALVHRVTLRDGGSLTGVLLDLDEKQLTLRTAWAGRLSLPRRAVAALSQLPGWLLLKLDRFDDLKGWEVQGKPAVAAGVVALSAGDSVEQKEALDEGTAGVDFRAVDGPAGALWQAEAEFNTLGGPRVVTITLAGADPAVKVNGLEGTASRWAPAPGWHRLVVRFSPSSLRVEVDDTPLWYNLERGPGGPLVRWRMACRPAGGGRPLGRVDFADFALHRADNPPRRPPGEADRDELWLADGDQVFGRVVRGDRAVLTIEGRFGRRTLPWTAVRAFYPRREPSEKVSAPTTVQIDNGADSTWDELAGVVTAWDDKHCRLRHAVLGELTLPRERIRSLRWPDRE